MAKNASSIFEKFKYMIGLDDLDEEYIEEEEVEEIEEPFSRRFNKSNKVVSIHTNNNIRLAVYEPIKFEDATSIIDDLKSRKPVVINFGKLEGEFKKQVFDFLNGGIYALEGDIQKVGKDIFVLVPKNVEIDSNMKDELKNKGIFPWQK